jgi:hypothetical protein
MVLVSIRQAEDDGTAKDWIGNVVRYSGAILNCVFRDPFLRPVTLDPSLLSDTVMKMATAIYSERAWDRLPILADALEEAGCTDVAILEHCRGPGPHVRGCWVVDLILGKA